MAQRKPKKQIGQLLIEGGKITPEQLEQALEYKRVNNIYLGKAILALGFLTEQEFMVFLSEQLELPYMNLEDFSIPDKTLELLSDETCRRHGIMPLFAIGGSLTIATSDPLNVNGIDAAYRESGLDIELVIATESDIDNALDAYYGTKKFIGDLKEDDDDEGLIFETSAIADDVKIVEAVDMMIKQAVKLGASDIHIEPRDKDVRIRFRVDGILYENYTVPKSFQPSVTSRIKIMAQMDIAESRKPQDGRITFHTGDRKVDLRVSTYPAYNGEKIVLRVLDEKKGKIELHKVGFNKEMFNAWNQLVRKPNGIVLVTGPTGSGKTSTLYATLNHINSSTKNIITIEDPIEYEIPNINQGQVNVKAGVTFSAALRTILRQDPDIIMVGEMRDQETVELAIRSALTGHLVFSTLHTNDAPSAITRLIDMGTEPYLIASTVRGILAQRLVRTLCPKCKERYTPPEEVALRLNLPLDHNKTIFRPTGCLHCRKTGYTGRTALFELMILNDQIIELIVANASTEEIRQAAIKSGMKPLRQQGIEKVLLGITSMEEVLEITTFD
ncbi:MAG TPA: type II/IV secretion system protein [Candidatus Marinimicrobia bacterium]|nr:type II/IV secretion system protein [Candidatus Neomarinimicrobiota bacterium]